MIRYITDTNAPSPAGHYSQAVCHAGHLFISGQLPVCSASSDHRRSAGEPFHVQAHRALTNMLRILAASGGSTKQLLKVSAYIVGIQNWSTFDQVYAEILGPIRPARIVVPVVELHGGYLVEVEAIAVAIGPAEPHHATL